jgi:hypothetical protein
MSIFFISSSCIGKRGVPLDTSRWERKTPSFFKLWLQKGTGKTLASLTLPDGSSTSDHENMAGEFLNAFKNRMGKVKDIAFDIDLSALLPHVDGLDVLTRPFEAKEIEEVIKEIPIDKAPGPDGFNGLFLKNAGTSYLRSSSPWYMNFM